MKILFYDVQSYDYEPFQKANEKFPEIYVSEICGIRDAFFVLLYGVTYWEKCLCITAAIRYKR